MVMPFEIPIQVDGLQREFAEQVGPENHKGKWHCRQHNQAEQRGGYNRSGGGESYCTLLGRPNPANKVN